jgi:hypothetical protein
MAATMSRRHVHGRERTRRRLAEEMLDKMLALPDPQFFRVVAAAEETIDRSPQAGTDREGPADREGPEA